MRCGPLWADEGATYICKPSAEPCDGMVVPVTITKKIFLETNALYSLGPKLEMWIWLNCKISGRIRDLSC